MNNSETTSKLSTALSNMQKAMKAVQRNSRNPFFKSNYADLAEIWKTIREPLCSNGLSVTQSTDVVEGVFMLITTLWHSSGEWITCRYPIIHAKDDPQSIGSALQYARRYSLSSLVGVTSQDDDEDDDGERCVGRGEDKNDVSFPALKKQMECFTDTNAATNWWKSHRQEILKCTAAEQSQLAEIGAKLTQQSKLSQKAAAALKPIAELTAAQKGIAELTRSLANTAIAALGINKQVGELTDAECVAISKKVSALADEEAER